MALYIIAKHWHKKTVIFFLSDVQIRDSQYTFIIFPIFIYIYI